MNERFPAWKRHPNESYDEFKKRFGEWHNKTLNNERKKEERKIDKIIKYRAWDQMPGESMKDFRKRLWSEKRTKAF